MAISPERELTATFDVPFAMRDDISIPRERYFDREFFELEKQQLWPRVWQMACRLDEIPNPGDYVEYEICDQSVLVVRQADDSVKAFENACRHRATQLAVGAGRLPGGQIVCPFHGWRWNLDGSNSYVFHPEEFAPECLSEDNLRLRECLVDTFLGSVYVNFDRAAISLRDYLGPAATALEGLGVGNMKVKYWREVVLNCNWKIAQEAFLESYHIIQTHPQLTMGRGVDYPLATEYFPLPNGHSQFTGSRGGKKWSTADSYIESMRLTWEGQDAMCLEREVRLFEGLRHKVPDDGNFAEHAIKALYEYAEGAGIAMPPIENAWQWGGEVALFPNFLHLPLFANSLAYRARPYKNDPEWCRFEVWSLMTYPEGSEPQERPAVSRHDKADEEHWGLIPRQDFSNVERQQRGLHTHSYTANTMSPSWDKNIVHMHRELDRYLAGHTPQPA